MLRCENIVWNTPEGEPIIKGITLDIPEGKLTAITGPNGGGKTTLAKVIAGLEQPAGGRVLLDGQDITDWDVTKRAKNGISYAFQQPVRFKGLTVRDMIVLAAGRMLSEDMLCDILSKVGLCAREYLDREVNASLSGGEIKRIEIATVLARHTKITVFDEPEAGIDLWSFTNLIEVFRSMQQHLQGALVIISHQERILEIADEIVVISDGTLKEKGPGSGILPYLLSGRPGCGRCPKGREEQQHEKNY